MSRIAKLSLVLMGLVALQSRAGGDGIVRVKMEGVSIFCATDGDRGFAFNHTAKQVWYSERGSTEGFKYTVSSYLAARCLNCFDVGAEFLGDKYTFKVRGLAGGAVALEGLLEGLNARGQRVVEPIQGACEKVQ